MSDDQASGTFEIVNKLGLHARAASRLVQVASGFPCDVTVSREGQEANAKSVMGVLLLLRGAWMSHPGIGDGEGASEVVRELGELIANRFGEDE